MQNEIVFYGNVPHEKYETILYKAYLEPRMTQEWRKQMIAKCEQLGATNVRVVEYVGHQQPNFTKAINV